MCLRVYDTLELKPSLKIYYKIVPVLEEVIKDQEITSSDFDIFNRRGQVNLFSNINDTIINDQRLKRVTQEYGLNDREHNIIVHYTYLRHQLLKVIKLMKNDYELFKKERKKVMFRRNLHGTPSDQIPVRYPIGLPYLHSRVVHGDYLYQYFPLLFRDDVLYTPEQQKIDRQMAIRAIEKSKEEYKRITSVHNSEIISRSQRNTEAVLRTLSRSVPNALIDHVSKNSFVTRRAGRSKKKRTQRARKRRKRTRRS
jgi:hypothetical protein